MMKYNGICIHRIIFNLNFLGSENPIDVGIRQYRYEKFSSCVRISVPNRIKNETVKLSNWKLYLPI